MITLDMYADVLCPWAYIGLRRLGLALEEVGHDVEVRWKPYLIDPSAPRPSESLDQVLGDARAWEDLQDRTPAGGSRSDRTFEVRRLAADLGIGPGWGPRWRANSWGAQRLITAAGPAGPELQWTVAEELLHAHFVAGCDVARLDVLDPIAERHGLPRPRPSVDGVDAPAYLEPGDDLRDDPLERATREALLTGRALGVQSSPTFVQADRIVAAGAQPPEILAEAIAALTPAREVPDEVRRLRSARALLEIPDPLGCLYLLEPLRPELDGDRGLELLTARALLASASLGAARDKLAQLLDETPDDGEVHLLMSQALRRSGDTAGADRHLRRAGAVSD
ncbi:DsbA family oxidoreductase [Mobilicoccus caccae]|uniref:DsbA family oxidoreductase n=1 Tax=Mobilicoccus caccae TaxID=1859295 RepID=UPI0024E1000C|nr:DsbA family protein [Mobilicoccus caccae]